MFHVLKACGRFFYDSKLSAYCIPAQTGPPIYIYSSDMLKTVDRLGLPFCRMFAITCMSYLEIFSVFDSDPIIIYVLFLLALFSPHKFLADHSFVSELLPVHSRYVQFLKQYILQRYANAPERPFPNVDLDHLFLHATDATASPGVGAPQSQSAAAQYSPAFTTATANPSSSTPVAHPPSSSASASSFASDEKEKELPFAQRLVEFALRTLDWFLVTTTVPIAKVCSRKLAEMQLLPPLRARDPRARRRPSVRCACTTSVTFSASFTQLISQS